MSFAHGAQDGLKFIGIMSIYTSIVTKNEILENNIIILLICALTMGVGVLIGGRKIVTTVGEKIVKLENSDALLSDISTIITLIAASFLGMPVSTTHVKTMAIVGAGLVSVYEIKQKTIGVAPQCDPQNKNKFKEILLAWAITFPICIILAFIMIKLII